MKDQANRISKLYIVSHTHWDREWYQDFQGFRKRLVHMMDELIVHMEQNPDYSRFTLDGQTIVLDDYMEIQPEMRSRLHALIQAGKIVVGPWYVMPDEFLVSGEALIRNFLKGIRISRSWGAEPMKSGYIVDIFGHNSQFPQLLQGFDINNAVLFRGFHGDANPAEFWWEGADGSRVLGIRPDEDRGYGDFYFAIRWPFYDRDNAYAEHKDELIERMEQFIQYKSLRTATSIAMGMDGIDHVEIEPQLPWLIQTFNDEVAGVEFVHCHLEEYVKALMNEIGELDVLQGELKALGLNGMNNWVPENTLSSRVHLKQHNQRCENLLEKWAEPLSVMGALEGNPYPLGFIAKSWEFLLQNHPHDSICGCSIDQVHRDMVYRFDQSRLISEHIIKDQLQFIVHHLDPVLLDGKGSFTVFNPAQSPIAGVVEAEITLPASTDVAIKIKDLKGTSFRVYDANKQEVAYQVLEIIPNSASMSRPYRELGRMDMVDRFRIAFHAAIPAFGYTAYTLETYSIEFHGPGEYNAPKLVAPVRFPGTMQLDESSWSNGRIQLHVQMNGTIDLTDLQSGVKHTGLLMLEDEADIGDGWSHVAPATNETVRSQGCSATISVVSEGRFLTRLRIQLQYRLPDRISQGDTRRSERFIEVPVTTFIELRKDDPILYCRTVIQNTARDHRLRMLFPTDLADAEHFHTSTPFDLIERPIFKPDVSHYLRKDFDVEPHNGIITVDDGARGLAIYSRGLYEAAVRDNKRRTIALTLFRSTRKEVGTDGGDGGQMLGELSFEYAIRPFQVDAAHPAFLWKELQLYAAGVKTVNRKQGKIFAETPNIRQADLPLTKSWLVLDSAQLIVSAFKRAEDEAGSFILRMFNAANVESQGILTFDKEISSVELVNLDEKRIQSVPINDRKINISARAKQIITLKIQYIND